MKKWAKRLAKVGAVAVVGTVAALIFGGIQANKAADREMQNI